jgi:hypothetical protein
LAHIRYRVYFRPDLVCGLGRANFGVQCVDGVAATTRCKALGRALEPEQLKHTIALDVLVLFRNGVDEWDRITGVGIDHHEGCRPVPKPGLGGTFA